MPSVTQTITCKTALGGVNCYLLKADTGFVLIDTGWTSKRTEIARALDAAGCKPGNLKLILLTHGDFDHVGNCAFLKKSFGTEVGMHHDDSGMVERGDMFWNRKKGNFVLRMIAKAMFALNESDRLSPDLSFEDGHDLSGYGLDAKVVHIPGHSKGSIGVLTSSGDLFCGDLFENRNKPALSPIMDDLAVAKSSVGKLAGLEIGTVYPGHGKPFPMQTICSST